MAPALEAVTLPPCGVPLLNSRFFIHSSAPSKPSPTKAAPMSLAAGTKVNSTTVFGVAIWMVTSVGAKHARFGYNEHSHERGDCSSLVCTTRGAPWYWSHVGNRATNRWVRRHVQQLGSCQPRFKHDTPPAVHTSHRAQDRVRQDSPPPSCPPLCLSYRFTLSACIGAIMFCTNTGIRPLASTCGDTSSRGSQ